MEKINKIRTELNKIGVIEFSLYGDTGIVRLMRQVDKKGCSDRCLCNYEFHDMNFELALEKLYEKVKKKYN